MVFFGHCKAPVQLLGSLEVAILAFQHPVANRHTQRLDTVRMQPGKVRFGHKFLPVLGNALRAVWLHHQLMLVARIGARKDRWRHPALKHQPPTQVNTA